MTDDAADELPRAGRNGERRSVRAESPERRSSAELQALILDTARQCFTKWGVQRTKMGDIAKELGIARPNLYRFYDSKQALVLDVMLVAHRKVNDERRRLVRLKGPVGNVITDAILVGWRLGVEDDEVRALTQPQNFSISSIVRADPEMIRLRREYWFEVFAYGRARSEIRPDLDDDAVMFWLTAVQAMFLEDLATFPDEDTVRSAIERFVLPAVLTPETVPRGRARRP